MTHLFTLTLEDIAEFIVTREQAEQRLLDIERKLAEKYNITHNVREVLKIFYWEDTADESDEMQEWMWACDSLKGFDDD